MKRIWTLAIATLCVWNAYGQSSLTHSSIRMVMVMPSYATQFPMADMADRFGSNSSIGMDVMYKNSRGWLLGLQGAFLFGSKVEQTDLFSNLITSQGQIIGTDGKYSDIRVFERGYHITLSVGKQFSIKKPNPNCGPFFTVGAGYLQHKIRVEDKLSVTPALQDDYVKGYDHLTGGLCLRQSAGFIYISNRRLVNLFVAAEAIEGFTKGLRSYDFDLEKPDTDKRTDILLGIRVGWILPLYKAAPEKYYLY